MKQITVISGKGGTGKTVIAAAFASLAKSKVMADCDVDAADLWLLLHPNIKERHDFRAGKVAVIDKEKCTQCGKCLEVCRFKAIPSDFIIDPISCEGCQVCYYICPEQAIKMKERVSGQWFISETNYGPMVHAKLAVAEENSGKLVTQVRQIAKQIAEKEKKEYIIIDGPPGIGCPVIASLTGVDLALIVTEPTLSGIHDLERVAQVARHFKIKTSVCINKYDINLTNSQKIRKYCEDNAIQMAGEIPFDPIVTQAMVNRKSIVEYYDGLVTQLIKKLWDGISRELVKEG